MGGRRRGRTPDEGLEDVPQDFDEVGGVHDVEGLQVLLVPGGGRGGPDFRVRPTGIPPELRAGSRTSDRLRKDSNSGKIRTPCTTDGPTHRGSLTRGWAGGTHWRATEPQLSKLKLTPVL